LLLKAAGLLHVEPAETWYVGDSRWDMLASQAAGMRAIAVLTGATAEAELRETGADAIYPTLREFMAAIPAD
jgi:pyrophosphatase PpaX